VYLDTDDTVLLMDLQNYANLVFDMAPAGQDSDLADQGVAGGF